MSAVASAGSSRGSSAGGPTSVARIPTSELRLTTRAAEDRLQALGYDDQAAALRHIAALSQGVSRQAGIQRQLLPAMLGWFAEAPNPDAGLFAFRQVSEALVGLGWSAKQAGDAVDRVAATADADADIATYLLLALRELRP